MKVLVAAGGGIGDLLRATPLIRALALKGCTVDVFLIADFLESVDLFRDAPEIRRLWHIPSPINKKKDHFVDGLNTENYDLAVVSANAGRFQHLFRARRKVVAGEDWLASGDSKWYAGVALAAGWNGVMPAPFAHCSARQFELPAGTVALHPGCKASWSFKRWRGFCDLARMLPHVALLGTEQDRDAADAWPDHAMDFIGKLSLLDTAALIKQSSALVSNDSGLMHLGVAMGTPTLGIFGITNPEREIIPAPHMHAITKGLPCEPLCRKLMFRRDCEYGIECLKVLTAREVYDHLTRVTPMSALVAVVPVGSCGPLDSMPPNM